MTEHADKAVWLTQEAYDRLVAELAHLKGPERAAISQRIAEAREEGDLRENGGYHAAREEQAKTEARISQLEDMLLRAQVGEIPADDGLVEPGMLITVKFHGSGKTETFLLGAREVIPPGRDTELSVYSPQSPLGTAIVGKHRGDTAQYSAPNGKEITVDILDAVPYTG